MRRIIISLAAICFILLSLINVNAIAVTEEGAVNMMRLTSKEFVHKGFIPKKFTCQGEDINPALTIENIPANTKSLALIIDDPDAPMGTWVHWVVYNIPVILEIKEDSVPGVEGINDFGRQAYGGPCPPSGTHRYFFKVYALSVQLNLKPRLNKQELEATLQGYILEKAELIGLYKKD